ncbi:oxytocin receptor-like [Galendromus occidentalis]|uniref:Oxytocin receptor-like n=1 Tax=Galendromus occidentalis TaxID=34638 RepID=A0AAJ7SJB7_9ACAR|nr:oxytocin receptor-like [Galendromus occidentalis]
MEYNITDTDFVPQPENWVLSVKCATLVIIFFLTLSSNLFVLHAVLLRNRQNRPLSRVQLFMLHLTVADILVALLNILPQLAWDLTIQFRGGAVLCKLVKFAQVYVLYLSTYILTGMSLDRLITMRAIESQWQTFAKKLIVFAWFLAAALSIPQLFLFSYTRIHDHGSWYDCKANFSWHRFGQRIYTTYFVVLILGVPVVMMLFCYIQICLIIVRIQRHHMTKTTSAPANFGVNTAGFFESNRRITKAKVRMVKMTFTVVLCFIVCWSPYSIAELLLAYKIAGGEHVSPPFMVFLLLASLNSAVNPWIYTAFTNSFACKSLRTLKPEVHLITV